MAPLWPVEVDVFTEPHSRMKKLVQKYSKMVSSTDFSSEFHMKELLQNLINVFCEFKAHEEIENIHIMRNLKRKLKAACVTSSAVCNCHSDNRLTDMLEMVVQGYRSHWTDKSVRERQSFGHKLQRAVEDFTENFIPHMEEEEEVFQPMLMQYFTYEELKELKVRVIHEHLVPKQHDKYVENLHKYQETDVVESTLSSFDLLPDEICEEIFSYLNPQDLGRVAQTSQRLNNLAKSPALWKGIFPVHWAAGKWTFYPQSLGGVDGDGEFDSELNVDLDLVMTHDEDADVDESPCRDDDTKDLDKLLTNKVLREGKLLSGLVKYLLPFVGPGVKVVDLAYSRGISSSLVHKILKLCPNVEVLDLTRTHVGDAAFHEYGVSNRQSKLRHLDLTNCRNITDQTLFCLVGLAANERQFDSFKSNERKENRENNQLCCHSHKTQFCEGNQRENSAPNKIYGTCHNNKTLRSEFESKMPDGTSKFAKGNHSPSCDDLDTDSYCGEEKSRVTFEAECESNDFYSPKHHQSTGSDSIPCSEDKGSCDCTSLWQTSATQRGNNSLSDSRSFSTVTTPLPSSPSSSHYPICIEECVPEHFLDRTGSGSEIVEQHCLSSMQQSTTSPSEQDKMAAHRKINSCCNQRGDNDDGSTLHPAGEEDFVSRPLTSLEFLSLNGCSGITDEGLQALTLAGGTPCLSHLDLSGCSFLTGTSIKSLVSTCAQTFDHAQLFYCDNIPADPFPTTASGCRNLGCETRFCCSAD